MQQESIEAQRKEFKLRLKEFHKQDFIELLSQLEDQGNGFFSFKDKLSLYYSIFDRRDFDIFNENYQSKVLHKANDYFLSMRYYIEKSNLKDNKVNSLITTDYINMSFYLSRYIDLLLDISELNNTLDISFGTNNQNGNFLYNGIFLGLNAHKTSDYFLQLIKIVNEINFFVSKKDLIAGKLNIKDDLNHIARHLGYSLKRNEINRLLIRDFEYTSNDYFAEIMYELMKIEDEYTRITTGIDFPLMGSIFINVSNYFSNEINNKDIDQKERKNLLITEIEDELQRDNKENLPPLLIEKINKITSDLNDYKYNLNRQY